MFSETGARARRQYEAFMMRGGGQEKRYDIGRPRLLGHDSLSERSRRNTRERSEESGKEAIQSARIAAAIEKRNASP